MLNRKRIRRNTDSVSVIGISALNDFDTAPGTPAGILIAQPLSTKKRYSSADTKAVMIPRDIPAALSTDVGMTPVVASSTCGVRIRKAARATTPPYIDSRP